MRRRALLAAIVLALLAVAGPASAAEPEGKRYQITVTGMT
jgi:hypothetical protein